MKISVVIPLFNKETWVKRALLSVLEQTAPPVEVIVVDDGSTDGSVGRIEALRDPRILVVSQSNQGVSAARNRGVAEAGSDWIAFLDADDWWSPDFLERCACLLESRGEAVLAGSNVWLDDQKKCVFPQEGEDPWVIDDFCAVAIDREYPPIPNSTCVVRKDALLKAGGFPVGVRLSEDTDTWARLSLEGAFLLSRQPLIHYDFGDDQSAVRRLRLLADAKNPPAAVSYRLLASQMPPARRKTFRRYATFCLQQQLSGAHRRGDWSQVLATFRHHGRAGGPRLFFFFVGEVASAGWLRLRAAVALRSRFRNVREGTRTKQGSPNDHPSK